MYEQVSVRHPDLVTHAGTMSAIGDQVTTAAQAGRAVRPSPEAYGKLCMMVPAMLGSLQDVLTDGIDTAAQSLHDTADRLRATAQSYDDTDQSSADALRGVYGGNGG
jgi:hypothetical protein